MKPKIVRGKVKITSKYNPEKCNQTQEKERRMRQIERGITHATEN